MANLLVLYWYRADYPMRATIRSHLYCFRRSRRHRTWYVNLAFCSPVSWLRRIRFDAVILHTLFSDGRADAATYERRVRQVEWIRDLSCPKAFFPQDEYGWSNTLCDTIRRLRLHWVFTLAGPEDVARMYPGLEAEGVRFRRVLPGYLEPGLVRKLERLVARHGERPVDIGYRSRPGPFYHGRHGLLKTRVADVLQEGARRRGMRTDLSTDPRDTFLGMAWFHFMRRCKYVAGVEGGASLLDRDGTLTQRVRAFVAAHPEASFEEVERECFPGLDGGLTYVAISPRHLEACATRTGQILVEGQYNGILRPGEHYLELKKDFSNLEAVLSAAQDDVARERMVNRAYDEVVRSGRFLYPHFVEEVLSALLPAAAAEGPGPRHGWTMWIVFSILEKLSWLGVMANAWFVAPAKKKLRPGWEALRRARTSAGAGKAR